MRSIFLILFLVAPAFAFVSGAVPADAVADERPLYLIDAHAQYDDQLSDDELLAVLQRAGISRVILATRARRSAGDVVRFAAQHPDLIVPSLRTKSGRFVKGTPGFFKIFGEQAASGKFAAFAEVLAYHSAKINGKGTMLAPEIDIPADSPQSMAVLDAARAAGVPLVLHYEFDAAPAQRKTVHLEILRRLMAAHRDLPFVLNHMAQLSAVDVAALIDANPNVYFTTAATSETKRRRQLRGNSRWRWTAMFISDGRRGDLKPEWRDLLIRHPDRFMLAFDGVFRWLWLEDYAAEVAEWRAALETLPTDVAHAIGHGNAERLWKLAPPY